MEENIRALLQRFQYSEQFKETAAFRIVLQGKSTKRLVSDFDFFG